MMMLINNVIVDTAPDECTYNDYAGDRCDSLDVVFRDANGEIRSANIQKGDTIEVSSGAVDTGTMYVSDITYLHDIVTLHAVSMPLNCQNTSNYFWDNVTFAELAKDMATEMGLTLNLEHTPGVTYNQVIRLQNEAINFMASRAALECYAIKIKDGILHVYDERQKENAEMEIAYEESDFLMWPRHSTSDAGLTKQVINSYRTLSGQEIYTVATADNIGKTKRENIVVSSIGESERFCAGILYKHNKNEYTTVGIVSGLERNSLETVWLVDAPGNFSGLNFIYCIQHNFVKEQQKLYMRKSSEE